MKGNTKYHFWPIVITILVFEIIFWSIFGSLWVFVEEDDSIQFARKDLLWAFAGVPLFIGWYLYSLWWKNKSMKRFGSSNLLSYLVTGVSSTQSVLKFLLLRHGFGFLIIAMANPQEGEMVQKGKLEKKEINYKGIEIMIALDISNSMLAKDMSETKSRLDIAKMAIQRLVRNLKGDKIGIVVFAGDAFVQLPITTDYSAVPLFLDAIDPEMIRYQGTALGRAIERCMESFDFENGINKSIILISDGENHEDDALVMASTARKRNVRVHTVGMGTPKGGQIPEYRYGVYRGIKRDKSGKTIISKLNESMLTQIAASGGGAYFRAVNSNINLLQLEEEIDKIEKSDIKATREGEWEFKIQDDYFQIYLLIGLILLLIEFLINERRYTFIERLKLFQR